jgi:hypothetical protein
MTLLWECQKERDRLVELGTEGYIMLETGRNSIWHRSSDGQPNAGTAVNIWVSYVECGEFHD